MSIMPSATVTCSRAADGSPRPSSHARPIRGEQTNAVMVRTAVVVEHRVYPLLPLAALVDQRVAQPHACAQIEDVLGRDPRLRQPVDHQQLAKMPGVRAVGLGALLSPPPGGGLRRLGQTHPGPKVEAVCRFVETTGGRAAIGQLEAIPGLRAGTAGMQIDGRRPAVEYWD